MRKRVKTQAPVYQPQWRQAASSGAWKNLVFPITWASLSLQGMVANTIYQFRYVVENMPPLPPTNLKPSNITAHSLTLSWTAPTGLEA